MESILMSIHPKWFELIAIGKKTIEVRKTAPKLQVPFKVYIYCTKGKNSEDKLYMTETVEAKYVYGDDYLANGMVVGEFVCDKIIEYSPMIIECTKFEVNGGEVEEKLRYNAGACLNAEEMYYYSKGKTLYGWHISHLKTYGKPKELGEFKKTCKHKKYNPPCYPNSCADCMGNRVDRPPQSWMYVED